MTPRHRVTVAVDGPAGSGKGSVCRAAAERFGLAYLDTGSLYRAVGLLALRHGLEAPAALAAAASTMSFAFRPVAPGDYRAFLEGEDVSRTLREEQVGMAASRVAAIPEVRAALLTFQRGYGGSNDAILDGRDVGTVILPDASLKIFLEASPQARAERRALELQGAGKAVSFHTIHARMSERDARDRGRNDAPLTPAADAILIDTTHMTLAESVRQVVRLVENVLRRTAP
ncbi:MAG: (d)CMP kinase [Magnetococcales bacterium]|nr:(d)CMP kinase [Magnetococcales bacterium]